MIEQKLSTPCVLQAVNCKKLIIIGSRSFFFVADLLAEFVAAVVEFGRCFFISHLSSRLSFVSLPQDPFPNGATCFQVKNAYFVVLSL